jgi:enoyl-CoA hydratase
MTGLLKTEFRDGRLAVTLQRPEKRNALSRPLLSEIARTFSEWRHRDDLRLAVLTGADDKAFAAGGDLRELDGVRTEAQAIEFANEARVALDTIRKFPVPVVALLNGDAYGGGVELALACDIRLACAHAKIGFVQARIAVSTAWGGGTDLFQLLPGKALSLLCKAEALNAQTAREIGLVDEVVPADPGAAVFAEAYLAKLAANSPQVMRAFKSLAIAHRFEASHREKIESEVACFARTWVHEDHWSAVERLTGWRASAESDNGGA